jgi:hypothetical protein
MIRTTVIAIAMSAIASAAWTTNASAKHHAKHTASAPAAQADTIPGVNPMTNAPASRSAEPSAAPAETIAGVNPMTNAPASKAVEHPAPYARIQGANPM